MRGLDLIGLEMIAGGNCHLFKVCFKEKVTVLIINDNSSLIFLYMYIFINCLNVIKAT